MAKGKFGGEPITILGDVTFRNWDGFAITKTSENKELAWEFIKSRMTDQYYSDNLDSAPFPVTKTGYKLYNDHHFYNEYTDFTDDYYDEDIRGYVGLVYHVGDDELMKIGKVTEEDAAAVDKYFNMATRKHKITFKRDKIYEIFNEEIAKFFNGGYTAEKCAEVLQDRISTYISEQIS
jgi:spermidine/putrescine-binding protein